MIDLPDRNTITLTPEGIKERHVARLTAFRCEHNVMDQFDRKVLGDPVLREESRRIDEEMRLDYCALTGAGTLESEHEKRDKTPRMLAFLKESIGTEVSAQDFADAADCSTSAAHAFMADHRGWFVQTRRGRYIVIDADRERATAKAGSGATLPAAVVQTDQAAQTAAAMVDGALAAMNGHAPAPAHDDRLPKP